MSALFSRCQDADYLRQQVVFFDRAAGIVEQLRGEAVTAAALLAVAEVYDTVCRWRDGAQVQLDRVMRRQHAQARAGFHQPANAKAMAQGCAAGDLGAGAPPTTPPDAWGASSGKPLFCDPPGQELPAAGIGSMIDAAREIEA